MRAIGRVLGGSVGTINREIKRNSHSVLGYQPYGVQGPRPPPGHDP